MDGLESGSFRRTAAIEHSLSALCDALNHCFEDYVVPFTLTPALAERRFRRESLDAEASTVWVDGEGPAAIALIARRGWDSRLAAMAVAKRHRGRGLGKHVMRSALEDARARGERRMVLEVIEQNPPAIGLYESVGFRKTRRIVGWERPPAETSIVPGLEECDPALAVSSFFRNVTPGIPWNLQPVTLAQLTTPVRAFTLEGQGYVLAMDLPSDRAVVWMLAVEELHRGKGLGRKLIEGTAASFSGKTLFTSVDVPDDLERGFFVKTGFQEMAVSQFEMAVDL